jgi:integrase
VASLEIQKGRYRIVFRYGGKKFQRALDTESKKKAHAAKIRVEENLELLRRGRLAYNPERDDLVTLLLSDGHLNAPHQAKKRLTLGEFFEDYQARRPPRKDTSTAYTEKIHIAHLLRVLGAKTILVEVPEKIQEYIRQRSIEKSRSGQPISPVTIKKELGTLSATWNKWGLREKVVMAPLTLRNLDYAKEKERPPFQTWEQIERRIERGMLTEDEQEELWNCLYLSVDEISEVLDWVKKHGCKIGSKRRILSWVYPMFAFCAYLGCRRSEMLRSRLEDLDFEGGEILLREKKKDTTKQETFRHMPMPHQLRVILEEWLKVHPGGPFTFSRRASEPITVQMANHYFRWALDGSKWNVVRGFHVFRHSLISNLAEQGVSEPVIMELVGHLNRKTTGRYLHLRPTTLNAAMHSVFGDGELPVLKPK